MAEIDRIKSNLRDLRQAYAAAQKAGNFKQAASIQKNIRQATADLRAMQRQVLDIDAAMNRLGTMSVRNLNKLMGELNGRLRNTQRGTAEFKRLQQQVMRVKTELQKVNTTLQLQESMWGRITRHCNNAQAAVFAFIASLTGLTMTARSAVNAFAEMEEQMANTRKFTGLDVETVEKINESWKKLDTRIAREKLNEFAQEAGRLGKNTRDSVQGYVDAAQIVNVALVDLGEGATQQIAKLAGIFDVEKIYGTRDAMLKTASVINVLSQNSTASKDYLVEFAGRLAGVGAQARMTIPQIVAFGAVLDANAQKVEMSASAMSRLIMMIFQKPAEIAQTAGMDVQKFVQTATTDTEKALLMFFDRLNELGSENAMSALAPMFKDLGMDGVRMAQVLAVLAGKIGDVKWQIGEANKAFKEGTSVINEYNIFNNTVQAQIDKNKKAFHEEAVELGERLFPAMKYVYTSGRALLTVVKGLVDAAPAFISILKVLVPAVVAYHVALNMATIRAKALTGAHLAQTAAGNALRGSWALLRLALYALTGQTQKATASWRVLNATMKASVVGAVATAVVALGTKLVELRGRTVEYANSLKDLRRKTDDVSESTIKEQRELEETFRVLKNASKSSDEYAKAKDSLISQYGQYLRGLIDERGQILDLSAAYRELTFQVRESAKARNIAAARDKASEGFNSMLAKEGGALRQKLVGFGMSEGEAATLVENMISKAMSGESLDMFVDKIKAFTRQNWGKALKSALTLGDSPLTIAYRMRAGARQYATTDREFAGMAEAQNSVLHPYAGATEMQLMATKQSMQKLVALYKNGLNPNDHTDLETLRKFTAWAYKDGKMQQVSGQLPESAALPDYFGAGKRGLKTVVPGAGSIPGKSPQFVTISREEAEDILRRVTVELEDRAAKPDGGSSAPAGTPAPIGGDSSGKVDKFKAEKEWRDLRKLEAEINLARGTYDPEKGVDALYTRHDYAKDIAEIDRDYYQKILDREDLTYQERLEMTSGFYKAERELTDAGEAETLETIETGAERSKAFIERQYLDGFMSAKTYNERLEELDADTAQKRADWFRRTAESDVAYTEQADEEAAKADEKQRKLAIKRFEQFQSEFKKLKEFYQKKTLAERLDVEMAVLRALREYGLDEETYQRMMAEIRKKFKADEMPDSAKPQKSKTEQLSASQGNDMSQLNQMYIAGLLSYEEFEKAKTNISRKYLKERLELLSKNGNDQTQAFTQMLTSFIDLSDWANLSMESRLEKLAAAVSTTAQMVTSVMEMASKFTQAQMQKDLDALEKRYDKEISFAEGNMYKVKRLEEQKAKEEAEIKAKAQDAQFQQQIIAATAQAISASLSAYAAVIGIPFAGPALAAAAAATALAFGMAQVAMIQKQKDASAAVGYRTGGFTPDGPEDREVGVVHAGEWVASQKLLRNPDARPLIEALDYAQRTNNYGSLTPEAVSEMVPTSGGSGAETRAIAKLEASVVQMERTMIRLRRRLDEPIAAVTTVDGDHGINRALSLYDLYIANKNPKYKKVRINGTDY